jgi:hypothetical protein
MKSQSVVMAINGNFYELMFALSYDCRVYPENQNWSGEHMHPICIKHISKNLKKK